MGELVINGETEIYSVLVPNIFSLAREGEKLLLAKYVAEIHNKRIAKVNEAINNNKVMFIDGVDVIDIKNHLDIIKRMIDVGIFNKQQVANSKNIYLLSESGYRILCNIFEDATISKLVLKEYFKSHSGIVIYAEKRKEILFRKEVDKIFNGLCTVIPQFKVGNYRIDMYIPELNIAIEFDEESHKYHIKEDERRQRYIEEKIGCQFVRVGEKEDYVTAVNKILKVVFGESGMTERDQLKLIFKSKTEKSWEMYEKFLDKVFK